MSTKGVFAILVGVLMSATIGYFFVPMGYNAWIYFAFMLISLTLIRAFSGSSSKGKARALIPHSAIPHRRLLLPLGVGLCISAYFVLFVLAIAQAPANIILVAFLVLLG